MMLAVMATSAFAQEQGRIRGSLNAGAAIPSGGFGMVVDGQIGYNIQDNMNVGVRWGGAAMFMTDLEDRIQVGMNSNFLGTFTYFLHNGGRSRFAPFAGGGLGVYTVAAAAVGTVAGAEADLGPRFGGMLTAGFEAGRFRMALEYNLVDSSPVNIGGISDTSIRNSYFAITAGFVLGGGRWGGR